MLKKLIMYRRRIESTIASFTLQNKYLEIGEYLLDIELRYLYKNDNLTVEFMNKVVKNNNYNMFPRKDIKHRVKQFFIPKKISIMKNEEQSDFKGSIYLLSNDITEEKDVKIFDIKNNAILTLYVLYNNFEKKIKDYNYFSQYFDIPKIISYDTDKKTTTEELLITKPKNTWEKRDYQEVIRVIFNSYKNYYVECARKGSYDNGYLEPILKELKEDEELKEFVVEIEKNIATNLISNPIPIIKQHGDLWLYNTMLAESGKVYFIDWEHSGEYFLFYDLFWWMQNEAIYNKDFIYIKNYILGNYDYWFQKTFNSLNYEYEKKYRKDYIYIFILELLYRRASNHSDNIKREVVKSFYDLFIQIEALNNFLTEGHSS